MCGKKKAKTSRLSKTFSALVGLELLPEIFLAENGKLLKFRSRPEKAARLMSEDYSITFRKTT